MRLPILKSELRQLVRLAGPLAAAQAGTQVMNLVDLAVLGRLGARELAAAGLGSAIFFTISVIGFGLVFGVDPLISQAFGAGDPVRARHVLWQGVWLTLGATLVLSVPLVLSAAIVPHFGMAGTVGHLTVVFVLWRTVGLAPLLLFLVARSYLQAQHITRPMIVAMIAGNIWNFLSDLVLVFGWGPIPPLGVAGAAISTDFGALLQLGIVVWAVRNVRTGLDAGATRASVKRAPHWEEIRRAIRVGLPVGLQMGLEIGIFALVGVLAGRLGTLELAAHQLVLALASFTFTVSVGIATAGSVRVGLAVGARDRERTRAAGFAAILTAAGWMSCTALILLIAPRAVARTVTDQADVIAAAVPLLFVAAVFQLSDGIQVVAAGALRGAGDTHFSFLVNLVGYWVIALPIALYLGFRRSMGVLGLWWGLCAGLVVVATLLFLRFNRLSSREIVPLHHRARATTTH
jgi:MATE family multidrug resistance protein